MMEVTRYNQLPVNQERRRTTILEYRRSLQLSLKGFSNNQQTKAEVDTRQQDGQNGQNVQNVALNRATGIPTYKAPSAVTSSADDVNSGTQDEIKFLRPSQIPSLKGPSPSSSQASEQFRVRTVTHAYQPSPRNGLRYLSYRQDLSSSLRSVKAGDSSISTTEGLTDPTSRNASSLPSGSDTPSTIDFPSDRHYAKENQPNSIGSSQKLEPTASPLHSPTKTTPQTSPRRWASYVNDASVASVPPAKSFRSQSKPWFSSLNKSSSSLAERLRAVDPSPVKTTKMTMEAPESRATSDFLENGDYITTRSLSLSGRSLTAMITSTEDDASRTQRTSHLLKEITVCSLPGSADQNDVVPIVPPFASTRTRNEDLVEDDSIGDDSLYLAESENRSQNRELDSSESSLQLQNIQRHSAAHDDPICPDHHSQVDSKKAEEKNPEPESPVKTSLASSGIAPVRRNGESRKARSTYTKRMRKSSGKRHAANASIYEYSAFPDADLNLASTEPTTHASIGNLHGKAGENGVTMAGQTVSGINHENLSTTERSLSQRQRESNSKPDSADSSLSDDNDDDNDVGKRKRKISKELMISAELVVKAILRDGRSKVKFTRNACFQALKKYADIQVEVKRLSAKLHEVSARASQPDIRATAEILKKENEKLKSDLAALSNRIVKLEEQAQKERKEYDEQIQHKEEAIVELQQERDTQQAEIEILTDRLIQAENEKEKLKDMHVSLSNSRAVVGKDQAALERLGQMQSRLDEQDAVLRQKEVKIKELEEMLTSQQSVTIIANSSPSSRVEDLRRKRGNREAAFRNQVSRLSSDSCESANVPVNETEARSLQGGNDMILELRKSQARAQELTIQLEQTRKELKDTEDKLTSLEEEDVLNSVETEALLEERAERIVELEEALSEMANKLFQLEKRSLNLGEGEMLRRNAIEGELKAAEMRILSLQEKLVETEEKLEAAEELLGCLNQEKEKVEELEELTRQNHSLIQSLREQLAEAQARAEMAEDQGSYGNRGHASFGDMSFATGGSDTDASRLLKQALADLEKARQENKTLQEQLVSAKSVVNDIREERDFANAKLSEVSGVLLAKRANQVEEHLYEKCLMYAEVSCELSTVKQKLAELETQYEEKVQECHLQEGIIEDLNRTWDAAASVEENITRMRIQCERNLKTAEDFNKKLVDSRKEIEDLKDQLELERLQKTNGMEISRSSRALQFLGGLGGALGGSTHSGFSLRSLYVDHDEDD